MKKRRGGYTAGIICACILGLISASCSKNGSASVKSNSKAPVQINLVLLKVYDFSDAQKVQDEMNKILEKRYNIDVKLTYIDFGSWQQQTNLLLLGTDCDILPLVNTPLSTYVANGQLLELDDYYAKSDKEFKSIWSPVELQGTKVNGKLYSITNLRNFANKYSLHMSQKIVDELNIDISSIKTMEDITPVLAKVHKAHPEMYAVVPQTGDTFVNGWMWDGLGDESWIGVLPEKGQTTKVQNVFDTADFKQFTGMTHKWYEAGYIMSDSLSNRESGESLVVNGKAFSFFNNDSNAAPVPGTVTAEIIAPWTVSNSYSALSYGINVNSLHPGESWKLLQALYTDADLETLLIDGIEGVHYVKNGNGSISYPAGVSATTSTYGGAAQYWAYPYAALTPPIDTLGSPDFFKELVAFNKSAIVSKAAGFLFDSTSITDQYTACVNVMNKYYKALLCGSIDPGKFIPQADAELKSAGIDTVIALKQQELDKFLKNK